MRVLDVGCGQGEVSRLISALVGSSGEVVGVDPDPQAIETAQTRFRLNGTTNTRFIAGDICKADLGSACFDAVVGRRVLMYLSDLDEALGNICSVLMPNGIVAFQEHDRTLVPGRCPGDWTVHDRLHQWIWDTVESEGANVHLGFTLPGALVKAGFTIEHIGASGVFPSIDQNVSLASIAGSMQDRIVAAGFAQASNINQTSLERQLAAEREQNQSPYLSDMAFTFIGRKVPTPVRADGKQH